LIIAMGIATYTSRLAARNTPSGSPRFLALPVLTLPCNRAKSCLLRRRPPLFDDESSRRPRYRFSESFGRS
jgi:hypothetical protein